MSRALPTRGALWPCSWPGRAPRTESRRPASCHTSACSRLSFRGRGSLSALSSSRTVSAFVTARVAGAHWAGPVLSSHPAPTTLASRSAARAADAQSWGCGCGKTGPS